MGILKGLLNLDFDEVVDSTADLVGDVASAPFDILEDTVDIPEEGLYPERTVNRAEKIIDDLL